MNTFIFQLFAICFLAYYCQGTEKEETKGKDKEKNTPAPSKVEKNPKKPDGAKIAYNAESSNAAEKPQNKKVKLCFEKADTNFTLIALHDFTDEPRDYYHILPGKDLKRFIIILYKMNANIFVFFREVELTFEQLGVVQAFCGSNEKPLYSEVIKPKKGKDGNVWQTVMMPVGGQQWNGLNDNEKIIFKDGNGKVFGTATAQVLVKTSVDWLEFDKPNINYYYGVYDGITHVLYKYPDSVHPSKWGSSIKLLF
ncbi:hypothetical protein niasHT_017656 [Heterodera trifolii]|uniref:Effector protein n=1 Tax=Heterodera trifolii TaxID=157864 RepID=A0ABD2LAE7_9BILA